MKRIVSLYLLCALFIAGCKKECPEPECEECPEPGCTTELEKGLLAYYPFNNSFNDESGNGNHGTATNGAFLTTDFLGRPNSAAGFDGFNDYIIVEGSAKLDAEAFTVSVQAMVNRTDRRNAIINRVNFDNASHILSMGHRLDIDQKFVFNVADGTTTCNALDTGYYFFANDVTQPGRWYNLIASFEKGVMKFYIDGKLQGTRTITWQDAKKCADADLLIGGWWQNDIVSVDGKVDEIYLYNRVLSDCEIKELSKAFADSNIQP